MEILQHQKIPISFAKNVLIEFGSLKMGRDIQSHLKTHSHLMLQLEFLTIVHLLSA